MAKSLLEQLPEIVANGRKVAEKILESLENRNRIALQNREWVLPAKDSKASDWISNASRQDAQASESDWHNRLIYGDNLLAMAALLAGDTDNASLRGKVDLIYIDPPFDSKADYRTKVTLPGVELEQRPTVIEQFAYSDTWSDGTASYLAMITPRLVLMRELLSDTGSIYVHLDWHVGHYVKLVMDEVFGKDNFVNEIIWHYRKWSTKSNNFQRNHDTIFWYGKATEERHFNVSEFQEQSEGTLKRWKGKKQQAIFDSSGKRTATSTDEETTGAPLADVWDANVWNISIINPAAKERVDYSTQKPEQLLERIIEYSCPEGGLVADFFGGSGTTAAVAERLGRRWVTSDLGKPACMIIRKRLIDQNAQPFLYQAIGDYQVEAAKQSLGRDFRIGDLAQIVLSLYGALPLPIEENPTRALGRVIANGVKTLVLADSPNKLTGLATLKKAIALRDGLMGGWDKVVVLGWNFDPAIAESINALNDVALEVLVIPPDLLDRLKKKSGLEKLRGSVRFASLQYLKIAPVKRVRVESPPHPNPLPQGGEGATVQETITITLANYVLLSPDAINLDEANRSKLQAVMNAEPLALIEYWAVDPDYDGKMFRSVWQDYRGNTDNDGDPLRVITQAVLTVPAKTGARRVCVRAVDVFGFEAEVSLDVAVTA
ncbi:site-specific DNA-methyltransferase [uncultured Deefgea sp.]|uniref:site-specific DNA-methyltransferase n=1 Tax=uncultured Deefgea sp. TaxID=1304914 RepID=UPI002595CBEB|nr:DNA methyltransferase [uncultured Deefgea sp.]